LLSKLRKLRKRAVLRAGYAAVLGVLVFSTIEAYRIQLSVSQQHLEIYRHYVDEENALRTLRTNVWMAGNYVRDFFIRNTPEQSQILRSQLDALKAGNAQALDHLARIAPQSLIPPEQRKGINDFWAVVDVVPTEMLKAPRDRQYEFVQRELVPRRDELSSALRELSATGEQHVQDIEGQFAESRRQNAERLLLMLGVGVLLGLLVALFSLRHAESLEREADRRHAEVEQTKGELQQLSARLVEVEEEGRRRLSRELHDEIGQTLALLQIQITNAQSALESRPAVLREQLQRARALVEKTVQTVRNISLLLRPALLDDLGLVPALQFQLEDFSRRSGIAAEFAEESVAEQLPDAVKTCVYRVVQEALHNCEKHSGATKVRLEVRQAEDALTVAVEDNGRGFHLNEKRMPRQSAGLGLLGIRERAINAGGSLVLDSHPGSGARIVLCIPLVAPATVAAAAHEVSA
jgi:signal transduction histidine kinase